MIIDPHYQLKHALSVDDKIILELVKLLDGGVFPVVDSDGQFDYFVTDRLILRNKAYKLIWLIERNKIYIGIVNAYRRKK